MTTGFPSLLGLDESVIEIALGVLLPTSWEIKVAVAASLFVIVAYWYFTYRTGDFDVDGSRVDNNSPNPGVTMGLSKGDSQASSAFSITLELLAAKNLIGANLNGTSDPYAIITCGTEKRFSSMVPGSRNPMWGEEFKFSVDELPAQGYSKLAALLSTRPLNLDEGMELTLDQCDNI